MSLWFIRAARYAACACAGSFVIVGSWFVQSTRTECLAHVPLFRRGQAPTAVIVLDASSDYTVRWLLQLISSVVRTNMLFNVLNVVCHRLFNLFYSYSQCAQVVTRWLQFYRICNISMSVLKIEYAIDYDIVRPSHQLSIAAISFRSLLPSTLLCFPPHCRYNYVCKQLARSKFHRRWFRSKVSL